MDNPDQLTVLSLCTGGAGLDLGFRLAVPGARTVVCVEHEAFAVAELLRRMEADELDAAPIWSDLKTFDGKAWRGLVDCVIGGYPCQPFSTAGRRGGSDDPRHLWPEVRRVIEEVQPAIVFLENVSGHLTLGFREVAEDLERMDYAVAATLVTASEVGASHKRERLFILGVDDTGHKSRAAQLGQQQEGASEHLGAVRSVGHTEHGPTRNGDARGQVQPQGRIGGRLFGSADASGILADPARNGQRGRDGQAGRRRGVREGMRTVGAGVGQADAGSAGPQGERPGQPERRGESESLCRDGRADAQTGLGHAEQHGRRIGEPERGSDRGEATGGTGGIPLFPPGPGDRERWAAVLRDFPHLAPATTQSVLCGLADGLAANRSRYLRLLGNGVVPLQAAYAFCWLWSVVRADAK